MANEDAILNQFKNVADEGVAVDASKRLRVGIIGTGWIADAHMEQYKKMPDVDIVAGADLVDGKAEAFFKKRLYIQYDARRVYDLRALQGCERTA